MYNIPLISVAALACSMSWLGFLEQFHEPFLRHSFSSTAYLCCIFSEGNGNTVLGEPPGYFWRIQATQFILMFFLICFSYHRLDWIALRTSYTWWSGCTIFQGNVYSAPSSWATHTQLQAGVLTSIVTSYTRSLTRHRHHHTTVHKLHQ